MFLTFSACRGGLGWKKEPGRSVKPLYRTASPLCIPAAGPLQPKCSLGELPRASVKLLALVRGKKIKVTDPGLGLGIEELGG